MNQSELSPIIFSHLPSSLRQHDIPITEDGAGGKLKARAANPTLPGPSREVSG